jgi:hypothetical protein
MRKHDANAPRYSCPFETCDRKGNDKGFLRLDKLAQHRKAMNH